MQNVRGFVGLLYCNNNSNKQKVAVFVALYHCFLMECVPGVVLLAVGLHALEFGGYLHPY